MGYREVYREENENAQERYLLVTDRLKDIPAENTVPELYRDYFHKEADFLLYLDEILRKKEEGSLDEESMEECRQRNERLYGDLRPENYERCYGNPAYAAEKFGTEAGQMLTFLYSELQAGIGYVFEEKKAAFVTLCELFVQVYNCFEQEEGPDLKEAKQVIYWYFHDYSEIFAEWQVTEMTDPGDELQASHPLRDGKVIVEDIEDNPGFFRVRLFAVPHFQIEGMDVNLSLVSQMPKAKA